MTQARKDQITRQVAEWNLLSDKSAAEVKMLRALRELLEDTKTEDKTLESEYKRGYEDGVHDEQDRQYEARMAAKKPKKADEKPPEPEEELPFGEVE